jgi:glyoxylase-like metal-dependent hydrolase (beta-lactamase superfamily II)
MKPSYPTPIDMGHEVYAIDLMEQNQPFRTAAYLIKDEKITLIETGSGASHHALLAGLSSLGITPEELDYIIVTHVHLDHAGGAGQLMDIAPKATLVVHPRGAKHMIDPTRLWEGATQVYGDKVSQLFGSVVPVAAHRVLVREHGETLTLGSRTLTFFDSPGHAKHHFTMLDNRSHALFAGDAVGIRYVTGFTHWNFDFIMPSSSPVDFDIQALHATLSMLEAIPFEWVYHAHFGRSPKSIAIEQTLRFGDKFSQLIAKHYRPELPVDELVNLLRGMVVDTLTEDGHHPGPIEVLDFDMYLDAMGLLVYQSRTQR